VAISWFDPDGLAVMENAAPKLQPDTPVLFIIGEQDMLHPEGKSLIFEKLPQHPKNAYTVVPGGANKRQIGNRRMAEGAITDTETHVKADGTFAPPGTKCIWPYTFE
jgi:fermentation-respiration switch protein FrsA (DUF1100 family)